MSWQEKLKSKMQITTGDGKLYDVLYRLESVKGSFDFNISEFHFPEVSGTKIDRRLRKGTRYPLEFYFQGDNHIDQWNEFNASCSDLRAWQVLHPFYGLITCHPLSIGFDSSGIGNTKVEVTVVESLLNAGPRTVLRPGENASAIITKSREKNNAFSAQIIPTVSDTQIMKSNVENVYNSGAAVVTDDTIAGEYFNLYNKAISNINNALNDVTTGFAIVQDFFNYPALFAQSVKNRLQILKDQALKLSDILDNLNSPNEKKIFESQKGAIVSAIIETVITPLSGDYLNAVDVFNVVEQVTTLYNQFIDELQALQTENGYTTDSYLPDPEFIEALNFSVNYAVSNLFEIALTAKQERVIYLEDDSNLIILAHRFYGLTATDSTIQCFADTNNIGLNEVFQIKKGRKLVYYV